MRVAYGRLGSPFSIDDPSNVKGDVEVVNLLRILARKNIVHLVTPTRGAPPRAGVVDEWGPGGAFEPVGKIGGVERDTLCDEGAGATPRLKEFAAAIAAAARKLPAFDAWVIFLGEHNGPCWPMPLKSGEGLCRPYTSRINYVWPLVSVLNDLQVEPLWLCPDPRNVLKCDNLDRALIGGREIGAQYSMELRGSRYVYAAIELLATAHFSPFATGSGPVRRPFGALMNEGSKDGRPLSRRELVRPWLTDLGGEIVGTWRPETCAELGIRPETPVVVADVRSKLREWKSTVALPANCSGWATAKAWEAFATGTVCFAHPAYDSRDLIYGRLPVQLRRFLRPGSPQTLAARVAEIDRNDELRLEIAVTQHAVWRKARRDESLGARWVAEKIGAEL